jgi:hypothetical protein
MKYLVILFVLVCSCVSGPVETVPVTMTETLSGTTDEGGRETFFLGSHSETPIVQVWCGVDDSWYQTPVRIADGEIAFQCDQPGPWRATILH